MLLSRRGEHQRRYTHVAGDGQCSSSEETESAGQLLAAGSRAGFRFSASSSGGQWVDLDAVSTGQTVLARMRTQSLFGIVASLSRSTVMKWCHRNTRLWLRRHAAAEVLRYRTGSARTRSHPAQETGQKAECPQNAPRLSPRCTIGVERLEVSPDRLRWRSTSSGRLRGAPGVG